MSDPKSRIGKHISRRQFLAGLGATGAAALAYGLTSGTETLSGGSLGGGSGSVLSGFETGPATTLAPPVDFKLDPADYADRVLVIVEMLGGNDGPSMFVPYGQGGYYDSRPKLAIPEADVIKIDDTLGLNPELADVANHNFAVVEGVGNTISSLSHFDAMDEWYGVGNRRVGYVAQLGNELVQKYGSDGLVTMSASGYAPQLVGATGPTLSIIAPKQIKVLESKNDVYDVYYDLLDGFNGGTLTSKLKRSNQNLLELGNLLPPTPDADSEDPMIKEGKDLGRQLNFAADMLEAGTGVKVIHAQLGGFDTHSGHKYRHTQLMKQVNFAIDGFLKRIENAGMGDRVMVALTSEFGRRAAENGDGFDHGNGSTLMVFGPVKPGRYGVPLDFNNLDDRGNFRTEVPFQEYLRTLAYDWLGVESVLPDTPSIQGLL